MPETRCSSCQASIFWTHTESGARMPIDYEPDPAGRVIIANGRARFLRKDETPPATFARFTSHFATCPHAARHRRVNLQPDYGQTPLALRTPAPPRTARDTEAERERNRNRDRKAEAERRRAREAEKHGARLDAGNLTPWAGIRRGKP